MQSASKDLEHIRIGERQSKLIFDLGVRREQKYQEYIRQANEAARIAEQDQATPPTAIGQRQPAPHSPDQSIDNLAVGLEQVAESKKRVVKIEQNRITTNKEESHVVLQEPRSSRRKIQQSPEEVRKRNNSNS